MTVITGYSITSFQEVQNPYEAVKQINGKLGVDWDWDTGFIHRKYIQGGHGIVFDFARCDEIVAGYVIARVENFVKSAAYLSFVVVDPEFQGKGIGSALMENVVAKIRSLAYKWMFIESRAEQIPFYNKVAQKNGAVFSIIGSSHDRFENEKYQMVYKL